jgi:hypothetical protein
MLKGRKRLLRRRASFSGSGAFVLEAGRLALFDDQRADQTTAQFFAAADMG